MNLIPCEKVPGVFTDEHGRYCYSDGSPVKWSPMSDELYEYEGFWANVKRNIAMPDTNERTPLLSDEELNSITWGRSTTEVDEGGKAVRDFYEAKITSGDLVVARARLLERGEMVPYCSNCGFVNPLVGEPCPKCGAKIVEG